MDAFQKRTLKTSRGYTYTYYAADGDASKPTLFFLHGSPDNAALWKDIAGPLRSLNHPIIIPDMLGYDGTDKPTDPASYAWDLLTSDLVEIIDAEKPGHKVISIGHDFGSGCASRLYNHYPERVVGLVNMAVAYQAPTGAHFDLEQVNQLMQKLFGAPIYSYWELLAAPEGAGILLENVEKFYHVIHGEGATMAKYHAQPGAMRKYLVEGKKEDVELRPYARDAEFKTAFVERMRRDGFEGPQCYYKAFVQNVQSESDKKVPEESKKVNVPVLYIGCKDDAVCRPEVLYPAIQAGLLPKLEQAEIIDAGHFVPYEDPEAVVQRLGSWLKKHFVDEKSAI